MPLAPGGRRSGAPLGEDANRDSSGQVVTFLFTDIERSSALWDEDPLGMRVALQLHDEIVRSVVTQHGGTIFTSRGDGFGASFSSATDALGAAVHAQLALARMRSPGASTLRVRMGVHTGLADQRDGNYFGTTVNRAARLSEAGHGGQVLVSSVTAALLGAGVDLVDLGSFWLEGLREQERIWWLPIPEIHVGAFPPLRSTRAGALHQPHLPTRLRFDGAVGFVGRARALDRLLQAWDAARSGSSSVVLVSGEPGVGKTRLVAEAASRLHALGATVLYGRCDAHGGSPFQPFAQALSSLAEGLDPLILPAVMAPSSGELVRLVPRLEQLIPGLAAPLPGDASGDQHRLFTAVSLALGALADLAPGACLVLDDLQWADPSTMALLEHLVVSVAPPGLAVVVIFRHTDVTRGSAPERAFLELRRLGGATIVHLAGLTLEEARDFVSATAGHEVGDLADVVEDLYARTGGNPFFLGEVIRQVLETGASSFDGHLWTASSIAAVRSPQGVRDLVRQRLAALPQPTGALLRAVAVFDDDLDLRLVSQVCGVEPEVALAELEPALESGLVVQTAPGCFAFAHQVARMAIYDDLPAAQRIGAHAAAARAIEELGMSDLHWSDLAHHWGAAAGAGHAAEAVASALHAAERALAGAALDAAAHYLRNALAYFTEGEIIDPVRGIEVQLRLGEVLTMSGRLDEAESEILDAADRGLRAGRADLFAQAALCLGGDLPLTPPVNRRAIALIEQALTMHGEASGTRALLLARLAERCHRIAPAATRLALVDEALDLARAIGDDRLLASVLLSRLCTMQGPTFTAESLELTAEVDRLAAQLPDDALAVRSAQLRMTASFQLDDLAAALQAARVISLLADRLRRPEYERLPLMWDAFREMYAGRFEAGSAIIDELSAMLDEGRHSQALPIAAAILLPKLLFGGETEVAYELARDLDIPYRESLLAWLAAEAGALARARHHLERADSVAQIELDQGWSWWQGMVATATAAALCDDTATLVEVRDALAPWAHQHATAGVVSYLGSGHLHLGVVEGRLGHLDAAVRELDLAVIAHEALGARPWVAVSQVELARVLDLRALTSDVPRAAELRAIALDTASELGLQNVVART